MVKVPEIFSAYDTESNMDRLTRNFEWRGVKVPQGFKTDFTTTFWWLRMFVPRYGKGNAAAVLHDYKYVNPFYTSRLKADLEYKDDLIALGYSTVRAYAHFLGVRVGGYWGWNNYRKQSTNKVVLLKQAKGMANKAKAEIARLAKQKEEILTGSAIAGVSMREQVSAIETRMKALAITSESRIKSITSIGE